MPRYGHRRRPFLDATSLLMLVAVIALRGWAPLAGPLGFDIFAPAIGFAEELSGSQSAPRPAKLGSQSGTGSSATGASAPVPLADTPLPKKSHFGGRIDTRVELLWAGELPRRWSGTISWRDASDSFSDRNAASAPGGEAAPRIASPVVLASAPILSGGVFETADGGLVFGPPSRLTMVPSGEGTLASVETRSGGISFRIQGRSDDRATLQIDGDDVSSGFSVSFTIGDLVAGNAIDAMINDRASVAIRRVAASDLRVRLGDSETIFWSEQMVDITLVNPMSLPIPKSANALVLDCLTYRAADDSLVSSVSFPVTATATGLHCPEGRWVSPMTNGAYRVRIRLRDTSADRGWLSMALSPTTMATSISRSITTTLPQSLTTPLNIPLAERPMIALNWQSTHEPPAIAETTFSVAVVAASRDVPFLGPTNDGDGAVKSADFAADTVGWTQLGPAVVRNDSSTVSRLFIQPTTQFFSAATGASRAGTATIHGGQRLTLLERGQQLGFAVPISRVGARHRAVIRVPRQSPLRLVAELVDIDPSTGVPQPLGPGLAIIRSAQQTVAVQPTFETAQQATAQVAGADTGSPTDSDLWHETVIDFWPRSPATRLVLSNRSSTAVAGLGRIDVMEDQSKSPEYPLAKQNRGEASNARLAAMRLEIADLFEQFGDRALPTTVQPLDYQQVWVAANRLIETLRREGYGGVILTVSSDGTSLFPDRSIVPDAAWDANWATDAGPVDPLRLLLRIFERESLQLIPCIRPSAPVLALEKRLRFETTAQSIASSSPLAGQLGAWSFDGPPLTAFPIYNSAHAEVISHFTRTMVELNERCRDLASVPMLGILADERSYLRSSPLLVGDEQTLHEFHASLGDQAPPRESFETWVQKSGADAFQRWRSNRLANGLQQLLKRIDGRNLLVMSFDSALPSSLVELGRDRRIITTRLQRRALTEPLAMRVRDEACNASVPVPLDGDPAPLAYLAAAFHQPTSDPRGFEPGLSGLGGADPMSDVDRVTAGLIDAVIENSQSVVTALLDPTESSIALAHLLNRSDRVIVAIGGGAANQPASDVRRRSLRSFAELPPVAMTDVESSVPAMTSLRVRMATHNDEVYIYAVNQTRWPVVWEAILSRPTTVYRLGPVPPQHTLASARLPADDPRSLVSSLRQNESGTRWQTVVAGGELVAIRVAARDATLVDWRATFAGSANQVATIRAGVDDAVSAIAKKQHLRRRDLIANPSFEADGAGVPGWMIAQYPTDCVAIDSHVAFHGSRSIRLVGQAGRPGGSWIVSQTIQPPRSGRLAVSVRLRGAKATSQAAEPLVVRMALEATVGGTPIRKTKSVTVAADAKWSEPQWLEIAKLPSLPLESLRLTIDLMSGGEVWIDDITCYDQFMTAAEKTHWEHLVFLAAGGLSRGDCGGASRLFDSHWALDFVNASPWAGGQTNEQSSVRRAAFNPSVTSEPAASSPKAGPKVTAPATQPASRPGWSERLKSWLPGPLRFGP